MQFFERVHHAYQIFDRHEVHQGAHFTQMKSIMSVMVDAFVLRFGRSVVEVIHRQVNGNENPLLQAARAAACEAVPEFQRLLPLRRPLPGVHITYCQLLIPGNVSCRCEHRHGIVAREGDVQVGLAGVVEHAGQQIGGAAGVVRRRGGPCQRRGGGTQQGGRV